MTCIEIQVSVPVEGARLPAMLHRPSTLGTSPLVIMIHGFTGDRVENRRLFVEISRRLCSRGVASIRFDLRGHGEGPGSFEDFDIDQALKDVRSIVEWVSRHPNVRASSLGLLGLSMGGYIAIEVTSRRPKGLRALALLSPAIDFTELRKLHSPSVKVAEGYAYLGPLKIKVDLIEKLLSKNAMGYARSIDVPTLIIHAADDNIVPCEQSRRFYTSLKCQEKKLVILDEGGHVFETYSSREKVLEEVIRWFSDKLT